jgi:hypothetical protein
VVCASGNLGLIYFTDQAERLSLESIQRAHPGLVDGLAAHPGIAFLMVYSESSGGPVAIGRDGWRELDSGRLHGADPLAPFGPHTAAFLRRLSSYPNVGDLVVNSLYEPASGQVAAFEELIGCHGGAGGAQTSPFVLYPSEWGAAPAIVGAEQLHHFLWQHLAPAGPAVPGPTVASGVGQLEPRQDRQVI